GHSGQKVTAEKSRLEEGRLQIVQVENLLEMRNENIVEIDPECPQKKERGHKNEWRNVTVLGKGGGGCHSLRQRPVKVHISAIHKQMLAGDVWGAAGKQKYYHRCDFIRCGHALFEWNFCEDRLELLVWVGKSIEPLAIQRSHNLRRHDCIHTNSIIQQFD